MENLLSPNFKFYLILIIIITLFSLVANATEWKSISSNQLLDSFIDLETIRINGDTREYWQKDIFKIEQ